MKQKTTKSFWLRLCAVIAVVLCCAGMAWGQDTYVKVNSLDDLVTGGEYILATTSSNTTYVASGFSSSALSTISSGFSLNDNIITVTSGSPLIFTLGGTSTGYTLQYTNSGTKYLAYGSSTNLNQSDKNTTDNAKWTYNYNPDLSSYVLLNVATTNRFIGLAVSGNKVFRAYSTQNYSTYPIACLYKKSTGSSSPATATTTTIDHSGITNTDVYTGTNAGSLAASVTAGGNAVAGAAVTWSGNNDNVATIDESTGAVTLVAAGTVTFTASYAGNNDYQASSATYELTVTDSTPFECVIFKAAEDKDKNNTATGKGSIVKDNVNFSCISGILGNGSEYRMYKNSTVTISTTDGSLITKIEFTGVSGYPASGFGNQTGWSTSGYNGIWTGEAKSVSFEASGAQVRATEIKVTVVANSNPSIIANDMYIAFDEESGAIEFTIQNPVTGGELTATKTGDWLTLGTVGETVPFSCEANEAFTARTASIVLTYTYGKSNIEKTITLTQAGNPNVPGTASNPFTVTQANEFISSLDNNVNSEEVYVKGVITGIKSIDVSKYERAQYYISDDETSTEQLLVYNGYYINGAKFTANDQIQVGDNVVVYGSLVNYNGTYEVAQNNKLISLDRPVKPEAGLEYKTTEVTATRGVAFTAPELTNPNNVDVTYSSSNEAVATVNAEGAVTLLKAGETTITASFAGDANYKAGSASYTLTVTVLSHKATFFVNGQQQGEPIDIAEDDPITFPVVEEQEINGKKFVGWTTAAIDGTTNDKPKVLVTSATMGDDNVNYYAVYANVESEGSQTTVTDELTRETTGVTNGSQTYSEWEYKEASSSAVYAGQSAGGNDAIQLRSDKSSAGVVTTTSGGKATKVVVTWNSNTAAGRTLNIYGSNTAYTAATDLYGENAGSLLGTIVNGTSTELTINENYKYVGLRSASGAMYLDNITITWESGTPATYSDYCTTVVAPVKPAKPIIFHDGGEYEGELTVAIAGEGTIKYTLNGDAEQTYTKPFTIDATTTIKAWTEQDGATSDVVTREYKIVETEKPAINLNGYYRIQNNGNGKYVNVAGRKTVTFVDEAATATAAGTVIKVETENAQVKVLRSQGVDVPGYADKAMRYVPKIVQLVAEKLGAEGEGKLLGKDGLDAIMKKFNESFDYHLYLEKAGDGYRIYGRTPSMKPVVDFYAENKANVDAKLPQLEQFINSAIDKVLEKTRGRGKSILVPFSLKTVWENMGKTLTEPVDETSTARFYEEVLSSETNVWNFAYETAMIYWTKVEQLINNPDPDSDYADMLENLGDYKKYLEKVPNIRPNFKYFIVQKDNKLDIISEGNGELNADFTAWTLEPRTDFSVAFNEDNMLNDKYYTTLYTDFAYTLPEGVKAYKVTSIDESGCFGHAATEEIGSQSIAAQTPVLLVSETSGNQTLALAETGTAVEGNWLVGPDYLINKYQIKTAQVETLFGMAKEILGESFYNNYVAEYEHLMLRTAGTVNNKYFFGLSKDDCKNLEEYVCMLDNTEEAGLAFANGWETMGVNKAFLTSDIYTEIRLAQVGDVDRSGDVTIADVKALVEIVLGKVTPETNTEKKYDFGAADVNFDCKTTIADVTALVNIILGKTQN